MRRILQLLSVEGFKKAVSVPGGDGISRRPQADMALF